MTNSAMRFAALALLSGFILIGCGSDSSDTPPRIEGPDDPPDQDSNRVPAINAQAFDVIENAPVDTSIGFVEANDPDGDSLTYSMEGIEGLQLNTNTGELKVVKNADFLDFESNATFTFDIIVSDGVLSARTEITLNIEDQEDGPLTNFEKRIYESFVVQVQAGNPENSVFKREGNATIFLSGAVTLSLETLTENASNQFNDLFTDGFRIEVVNDSLSANVQLYSSSLEDLEATWPDFYQIALDNSGLGGIAEIGGGRIWVADYAQNNSTIKHEMGHMIGLLHAPGSQCAQGEESSNMCGGVNNAGPNLNAVDERLMRYYYHPEIPNALEGSLVEQKLIDLMLADRMAN